MRVAVLSAGGGAWGAGGAGSGAPEEGGANMRVNSPACWNGLLSGGADWAALACSFSISMDSPESREPNKRSNWPVSGEASLADDAGHGEPGAAGGKDPPQRRGPRGGGGNARPGRRARGGGADGGGGGLRGSPEPSGAWNSLVNSEPWLCAAVDGAAGGGAGASSKSLVNSPAAGALGEGAGVFGGPESKMRVNSPRWSASRLAAAGGAGAAGGVARGGIGFSLDR